MSSGFEMPIFRSVNRFRGVAVRCFSGSPVCCARGAVHVVTVPSTKEITTPSEPFDRHSVNKQSLLNAKKDFNMGKFVDAVRGDLDPADEQKHFRGKKPTWMKKETSNVNAREDGRSSRNREDQDLEEENSNFSDNRLSRIKSGTKTSRKDRSGMAQAEDDEEEPDEHRKPHRQASRPQKIATTGTLGSEYRFLDDKDKTFRDAIALVKNRKDRMNSRKILLEGYRLIHDAMELGVRIQTIFFSKRDLLDKLPEDGLALMRPRVFQVSLRQMALWSDMTTPPGIVAIAEMPPPEVFDTSKQMPLTVICDNIRDPGNMGAILRVLAGAACYQVIAIKGCVDPWDPKVIRSGMGAHFHVPILWNVEWHLVGNYLENPTNMFLADNLEDAETDPLALKPETQRPKLRPKRHIADLEIVPYHQVDFGLGGVTLVIGGETHGVSESAYSTTAERRGKKLIIPMGNDIESLNAASVVAVLAFEMRRQRLLAGDDA